VSCELQLSGSTLGIATIYEGLAFVGMPGQVGVDLYPR
jgi:hypothetical protein